jgi:hypothetical protein
MPAMATPRRRATRAGKRNRATRDAQGFHVRTTGDREARDTSEPAPPEKVPRWQRWLPPVALLLLSVAFRVPALMNAAGTNSDAAIVGLQAMHILRGEWSWFLWGTGYQGSVDPLLTALAFAVTGPSPLVLMCVPLALHLVLVWLVWDILRRHLHWGSALVATMPVVLTPWAVNSVVLYLPRQACITLLFLGLWLLEGINRSPRPRLRLGLGVSLGVLSLYLDLFALQIMVAFGLFALLCSLDLRMARPALARRLAIIGAAAVTSGLVVLLLRQAPHREEPTLSLTLAKVGENWQLLTTECLPYLLGAKVYARIEHLGPQLWHAPWFVRVVQWSGAVIFGAGLAFALLAIKLRRLPWDVRRLGLLGGVAALSSLGAFVVSMSPYDVWAVRYLAPMIWLAPFALAPAAALLRARWFAAALAPYLVAATIGGWLSYGPYVRGAMPVRFPRGVAQEEQQLAEALRSRQVKFAAADYWLAYRLSFLFHEDPIVVPLAPHQDRYPPYRKAFLTSRHTAFIFHPMEPGASEEQIRAALARIPGRIETLQVADYTVLLFERTLGEPRGS